jgi:hypothetical protein
LGGLFGYRSNNGAKVKTNTCKSDFTTPLQLVYPKLEDARQAIPGTTGKQTLPLLPSSPSSRDRAGPCGSIAAAGS